jgi:hypothetical protein
MRIKPLDARNPVRKRRRPAQTVHRSGGRLWQEGKLADKVASSFTPTPPRPAASATRENGSRATAVVAHAAHAGTFAVKRPSPQTFRGVTLA